MLSSADTARAAVADTILALERSCLEAESAFVERRWDDVERAFGAQSALTGELGRLFVAEPQTAPENDVKVEQRVRGILAYRDDQLRRMRVYHADVESRLQSIGKVRALSRSIGNGERTGALYDTQQ